MTTKLERAELGLGGADFLRLRAVRLLERFVLRFRCFATRLPVDLLERLGGKLAEENAGDEEIGGDALVDGGVVVEKRKTIA